MQNPLPTLVIAATGKTGRRVADRLEALGRPVRRGSRSGATRFDWNDPATWGPALDGVESAYVVYSPDLAVPAAPDAITREVQEQVLRSVPDLVGFADSFETGKVQYSADVALFENFSEQSCIADVTFNEGQVFLSDALYRIKAFTARIRKVVQHDDLVAALQEFHTHV